MRGAALSTYENAGENTFENDKEKAETALDVEDDRTLFSSISTESLSCEEGVQPIH